MHAFWGPWTNSVRDELWKQMQTVTWKANGVPYKTHDRSVEENCWASMCLIMSLSHSFLAMALEIFSPRTGGGRAFN